MTGQVWQMAAALAMGLGAIGRNPDAVGDIRGTMILGAGLAEAVAIYAFVVALVLLFVAH